MSAKDSITTQTCELSKEEHNDFLTLYPIPSKYHVILSKSNQTIFDAPPGFIYRGSTLLVVLNSPLLLSCAKLMIVSPLLTSSEGSSICVELSQTFMGISLATTCDHGGRQGYLSLLLLFPFSLIHDLLFLSAEMDFRNSIYTKDDEDLSFLTKEPSPGLPIEVIAYSGESLKPELFVVHPRSVAARIKDRKCKTRGGSSTPPVKRKLALGSSTSHATRANTSSSKDDVPFLTVSDDDEGLSDVLKLKDATICHLKISAITPPALKNHLDNHMDVELLDLHNRCYARQVVVDNAVKRRSRKLLQVIEKLRGEFDVMRSRERAREEECEGLRVKCEAAMTEFEKNPDDVGELKVGRLSTEPCDFGVEGERWYQVVPYATMELVHSDDTGSLVGRLVSSAILYGRCKAYDQIVDMKEPFDLSKVKGYCSSYKKDHTQANNDLATTTFPWLDEFVADPSAPIKVLLLKKP
ncbi:hypothetical protein Tco_0590193 [Tanacetum coccineum]